MSKLSEIVRLLEPLAEVRSSLKKPLRVKILHMRSLVQRKFLDTRDIPNNERATSQCMKLCEVCRKTFGADTK